MVPALFARSFLEAVTPVTGSILMVDSAVSHCHMHPNTKPRVRRRTAIGSIGLAGAFGLVGCLGDDDADDIDEPADDTDDAEPVLDDEDDTAPEPDDEDDEDDEPEVDTEWEVHDVTMTIVRSGDHPADVQYNPWAQPLPIWDNENIDNYWLANDSLVDGEVKGGLIEDWSYEPGVLEFTLNENVYWWSGDQLTADDYLLRKELEDFMWGDEELDAHPNIVAFEKIDTFSVRLALRDVWREPWALRQTINEDQVPESQTASEPWVEQFRDSPDLEAIEDLREELADVEVTDDEELVNYYNFPFEFRLDDSIGAVGEEYWDFELVREKNGVARLWAEDINYRTLRIRVVGEPQPQNWIAGAEYFVTGDAAWVPVMYVEGEELDFPVEELPFQLPTDQWGFTFNDEIHPSGNVNFRRAWAYMTDSTYWEDARFEGDYIAPESFHPFLTDERLERFVSEDVWESFTDYRPDTIDHDAAADEMTAGGFEQNGDGAWIMQEDGADADAGEPIRITSGVYDWQDEVADYGTDWLTEMEEFGIVVEVIVDHWEDPYTVAPRYTGGGIPDEVFNTIYGNDAPWLGVNPNLPSTVAAPPVGEPDADPVEYDTRAMAERLPVTEDEDPYQDLVDELAWITNQTLPRYTVVGSSQLYLVNDERWSFNWDLATDRLLKEPFRVHGTGLYQYVPEEER